MSLVLTGLLVLQVLSALTIIVLVLLQQGKGSDMGSAFGGGSAGSLFGAAGAANFLSRLTKWAAIVFFATTLGLAYISHNSITPTQAPIGVMEGYQEPSAPVLPGDAPDATVPDTPSTSDVPQAPADAAVPSAAPAPAAAPETPAPAATPSTETSTPAAPEPTSVTPAPAPQPSATDSTPTAAPAETEGAT